MKARQVYWTEPAKNDLREQAAYIARDNPSAARGLAQRVRAVADALGETATGHFGRVDGTYENRIRNTPYIIVYSFEKYDGREVVAILRVIHASRNWPEGAWPE